jgi:mannan endo-1,4-beta-mannosidase
MATIKLCALALLTLIAAAPTLSPLEAISSIVPKGGATPQILQTFLKPNEVNIARNSYVYRDGTTLRLLGDHWTASGANVYWLGLDENVIPPAGEPFYPPFNASYPTLGRIKEVMSTLVTMGAKLVRSQTLGVSVGNPLSMMPTYGVVNEQAFATMDWAIFQARQHGLRIMAPLIDDYVSHIPKLVLQPTKKLGLLSRWKIYFPPLGRIQYYRV